MKITPDGHVLGWRDGTVVATPVSTPTTTMLMAVARRNPPIRSPISRNTSAASAEKSGISRQAFLACLNNSVMGSTFSRYKTPAFVNLDFHATFTSTLLRKDFDLGMAAAREREVPMPVASLVHQLVQSLVGHGAGEEDFATLIRLQAQSAGLELVSEDADVSDGLDPAGPDPAGPDSAGLGPAGHDGGEGIR